MLFVLVACASSPAPTFPPSTPTPVRPTSTTAPPTSTTAPTLTPTAVRPTPAPLSATSAPTLAATVTRAPPPLASAADTPRPHVAMTRYEINKVQDPNAVCNDGSTAIFFYRRGYGSGANNWVIFLRGGGVCWDPVGCASRDPSLTGSNGLTEIDDETYGITSDAPNNNPDFTVGITSLCRTVPPTGLPAPVLITTMR
jgi:hypothetical protein